MEEKINIAEILKDKKEGIRLYSPIFGECTFCYVREDTNDICVKKHNGVIEYFNSEGLYFTLGEVMLFPSKSMRDWEKFSWNRGDVLVNSRGLKILFDRWANDNYTSFYAKTINLVEDGFLDTNLHTLASEKEAKSFIKCIEERFGGKLNLQTLEIQKQPEFKDGDILFVRCNKYSYIEIFNYFKKNGDLSDHASLNITRQSLDTSGILKILKEDIVEIRLATEEEKQQLFSALEKEGKDWDSEHKMIVDLKPKYEFKPMDLCLMKYIGKYNNRGWELCQYAYTEHRVSSSGEQRDFYHSVGGEIYAECIPYNEDTKHLLGTKNEWKGGEG